MAYQLTIEEMVHALKQHAPERANDYARALSFIGSAMAEEIAKATDTETTGCNFDMCFAAPFYATEPDQPLPVILIGYDVEEEFGPKLA